MEFATVELPRAMTPDQATELIGDKVPDLQPNITTASVVVDANTKEPQFAYLPVTDTAELRRSVLGLHYSKMSRAKGYASASTTFGYSPRRPVYGREGCGQSQVARDQPRNHRPLAEWASRLQHMLHDISPEIVEHDQLALKAVDESWRLGESDLWTSGVINRTSRLPYHRDTFNFNTWSAMPVLRRHVTGGYLAIPEYGAVIACRDSWAVFFPGYRLVHGVTPMHAQRDDGYRISIVYYALKGMKDCFTAAVETEYAKKRRTEREREMAARLKTGDTGVPRKPELSRKTSGRLIRGVQEH